MKLYRFVPIALLALMLAACVSAPGPHCVRLAFDGWFCLLAPAALPQTQGTNLVTVTQEGQSKHFVGRLSITPAKLQLALLSLAGLPAATLHWDGNQASIESPSKAKLDAQRLLTLLELTLAAPAKLRPALHGLTLSTHREGAREVRELHDGSDLVARAVIAQNGATHIEVPRVHLEIKLTPLEPHADE